ncbi:MAG: hypothetical protein ABIG61_03880 [Planctomycetota bacterium]
MSLPERQGDELSGEHLDNSAPIDYTTKITGNPGAGSFFMLEFPPVMLEQARIA